MSVCEADRIKVDTICDIAPKEIDVLDEHPRRVNELEHRARKANEAKDANKKTPVLLPAFDLIHP